MRTLNFLKLVSIVSQVPPLVKIPFWDGARFGEQPNTIMFEKAPVKYMPAGYVLEALRYLPCRLGFRNDGSDYKLYITDPCALNGTGARPIFSTDIHSPCGELVVKEFDDGKYTAVFYSGQAFSVLRHDSVWRDMVGDKFVSALFLEMMSK